MWMTPPSRAALTFSVETSAGLGELEIFSQPSWDTKAAERRNQGGTAKDNILILL
jgi:hypothetical protein